jgi:hypothetical protein
MKILKNLAIVALLSTFALSCENSSPTPQSVVVTLKPVEPAKPEVIDPNKCYEGEIVWITANTKGLWVQVLNGNIGDPSEDPYPEMYNQKKWTNTVWIANAQIFNQFPYDKNLIGKKIFFKLNPNSNFVDCQEFAIGYVNTLESGKTPNKRLCATNISITTCN